MSDKRKFSFPANLLLDEGRLILNAASDSAYAPKLNARLPADHVQQAHASLPALVKKCNDQKLLSGDIGELTRGQNESLRLMQEKCAGARDTAKKAFPNQKVKLREQFGVGERVPTTLAGWLERGRLVLASARKPENIPGLKSKGWTDADATGLETAIDRLNEMDGNQEEGKVMRKGATTQLAIAANEFYDAILAIQNAVNLEWPESNRANAEVRAKFRLGQFPPRQGNSKKVEAPTLPSTPPPVK